MAENNSNGVENKNKNNDGSEKKKADGPIASKFVKLVKSSQGAESVKSEGQANKLALVGKVDPTKLRDELATKTKTKYWATKPKKDNKVNKDTKKKQPEKIDSEIPEEALYKESYYNSTKSKVHAAPAPAPAPADEFFAEFFALLIRDPDPHPHPHRPYEFGDRYEELYSSDDGSDSDDSNDGNNGNHGNDSNHRNSRKDRDGNGGGGGVEKKKKEDEGNGGGKMKYPAGAETVKFEGQANKLMVGKVDLTKLRDELATKTKNKVDLISP